jgi:catechol-2,3-dioxygenase
MRTAASPTVAMRTDRRSIYVNDLVEAERFYVQILGQIVRSQIIHRYMLCTEEVLRARQVSALAARHGEQVDPTLSGLPYTRVQVSGADIVLCLADHHIQEPPPGQVRGFPRIGISFTPEQLDRAPEILTRERIPFEGPVEHPPASPITRSLYLRDPAGNFLEFCCPR